MAGNLQHAPHVLPCRLRRMTSALVLCPASEDEAALARALQGAGIHMLGAVRRGELVREAARRAPDVIVCIEPHPCDGLFAETAALQAAAPCPVIVFTDDADALGIERSVASGVHAYVVDDGHPRRLQALVTLARSRFAQDRKLRAALRDASERYEDRRWIDRAKGVLMRTRAAPEGATFREPRSASLRPHRKVGGGARAEPNAARDAEGVDLAGALRMLSQRAVKLQALLVLGAAPVPNRARLDASLARIAENLRALETRPDRANFGDLLDAVQSPWTTLAGLLREPPAQSRLAEIDAQAERLLAQAERLTTALCTHRSAASLRVIDLAGRQRMWSQRLGKAALLAGLLDDASAVEAAQAAALEARRAFEAALGTLQALPLKSAAIGAALHEGQSAWREMTEALPRARTLAGQCAIGEASETVLAVFERLTVECESSMQVLIG